MRVYFQRINGPIDQATHVDNVWSNSLLKNQPVIASPLASVTYDEGKEIRLYSLDASYAVQESCYSEGKGWYPGDISQLSAKVCPTAGLAAVVFGDEKGGVHLRVYYQETGTHAIKELANDGHWHNGELSLTGAITGTNLAAVAYNFKQQNQIRLYYQALDLSLKEYCYDNSGWSPGGFNPGKAVARTPLSALAFGEVELQVYWRHVNGHIVVAKNTGSWSGPTTIHGIGPGYYLSVLQWDKGKHLRLYFQDFAGAVYEFYSDNSGREWSVGHLLSEGPVSGPK